MSELRWYQQYAVDDTLAWMAERPGLNPLIVAPMGSGKVTSSPALCGRQSPAVERPEY